MFEKLPSGERELLQKLLDSKGDFDKGGLQIGDKIGIIDDYWYDDRIDLRGLKDKGYLVYGGTNGFSRFTSKARNYFEMEEEQMKQNATSSIVVTGNNNQIQQGVSNSEQNMQVKSAFDFEQALDIFNLALGNINKLELQDKEIEELRTILEDGQKLSQSKSEPERIKNIFNNVLTALHGIKEVCLVAGAIYSRIAPMIG